MFTRPHDAKRIPGGKPEQDRLILLRMVSRDCVETVEKNPLLDFGGSGTQQKEKWLG